MQQPRATSHSGGGGLAGLASPFRQQQQQASSMFPGANRSHSPTASTTSNSSLGMQQHLQHPHNAATSDFDASDFPALSSDSNRGFSMPTPGALSYAATGSLGQQTGPASGAANAAPGAFSSLQQQRELSAEDFPALGNNANPAGAATPSASAMNGLPSAPARPLQIQQEQAAAAALAHRQGLLGSLTAGQPSPGLRHLGLDDQQQQQKRIPSQGLQSPATPSAPANGNGIHPHSLRSPSIPPPTGPRSQTMPSKSNPLASAASMPLTNGSVGAVGPAVPPPHLTHHNPGDMINNTQAPLDPTGQTMPQTPAQQILLSPADRFGLVGLLHLIRTDDPDAGMLSLGSDLSKLGLDMNRRENLASTFVTPWADAESLAAVRIEPEFTLPACYNVNPPAPTTKVSQVSDETLFYMFYTQPRDVLQDNAAQELYRHNWRYHKELKLWLTKETGVEPTQKTSTFEKGTYVFFEPTTWEKQVKSDFTLVYDQLEKTAAPQAA